MKKPLALLLCSSLFFSFSSFAQNILGNLTPQFKAKIVIEDQKANQNAKTTNNKVTKEQNNKVNDALKGKKLPQDVSTTIKEKIQNTSFCQNLKDKNGNNVLEKVRKLEEQCANNDAVSCKDAAIAHYGNALEQCTFDLKKTVEFSKKGCNLGNGQACYNYAFLLRSGEGIKKDIEKSFEYFEKACDYEDGNGCMMLAINKYLSDERVKDKNIDKGFNLLKVACQFDSIEGCYNLGVMYRDGLGTTKNDEEALKLFNYVCLTANDRGCSAAGELSVTSPTQRNLKKAYEYYEKSCRYQNPNSCLSAGKILSSDVLGKPNYKKSFDFYRKACDADLGEACNELAIFYADGLGVEQSIGFAEDLFEKSCSLEFGLACSNLGKLYEMYPDNFKDKNSPDILLEIYQVGCKYNDPRGCIKAGVLTDTLNTKKEKAKYKVAYNLFKKGCELNDGPSCYNASLYIKDGLGTKANDLEAYKFKALSCKFDYGQGCFEMARELDSEKHDIKITKEQIIPLYDKACKLGVDDGCILWANNVSDLNENPNDIEKALDIFKNLCEKENPDGCHNAGNYYFTKEPTKENIKLAKEYFTKGCQIKDADSCSVLGFLLSKENADKKFIFDLFKKSCDLNSAQGCRNLGVSYENGDGVPQDKKRLKNFMIRVVS